MSPNIPVNTTQPIIGEQQLLLKIFEADGFFHLRETILGEKQKLPFDHYLIKHVSWLCLAPVLFHVHGMFRATSRTEFTFANGTVTCIENEISRTVMANLWDTCQSEQMWLSLLACEPRSALT